MQRRLEAWFAGGNELRSGTRRSRQTARVQKRFAPWFALLAATVAFAVYHVPYAYLSPHWPSHGDLGHAVRLALIDGTLGGLVTGTVFIAAKRNLLAAVIVHALVDLFPAITMIRFGG